MSELNRLPLETPTIAYIRDAIRKKAYVGDLFVALEFLLGEYDTVYDRLKFYIKPVEYTISTGSYKGDIV